ncbi:MAG: phosphatase PAP2 family protein [Lachnospiraceae bacterium]|nr:phosphatase PAP2 family protein [Lachnospiraceae bacterium]
MKLIKQGLAWCKANKHSYAMLYLIFYVITFFTLDFTLKSKVIIHSPLDDLIPFCEYFVIPYSMWFAAFPSALVYLMIVDKKEFQDLWFIMFTGMNICFIINIIMPTGLDLRVDIPDRNFCAFFVNTLWKADGPVNVCPSMHCSSCSSVIIVALKSKALNGHRALRIGTILLNLLIIVSTVMIKQHSIIDVVCGVLLSVLLAVICYTTPWREGVKKTFLNAII